MSDQKTPSESVPAEQREQQQQQPQPEAPSGQAQADAGGGEKKAENATPPTQLRSHYKGMPKQWEKNKDKFPPKDE